MPLGATACQIGDGPMVRFAGTAERRNLLLLPDFAPLCCYLRERARMVTPRGFEPLSPG